MCNERCRHSTVQTVMTALRCVLTVLDNRPRDALGGIPRKQTAPHERRAVTSSRPFHKREDAIAMGHCNLLERDALLALARAQMARDIVMATALRPYVSRAVVLLAGILRQQGRHGVAS